MFQAKGPVFVVKFLSSLKLRIAAAKLYGIDNNSHTRTRVKTFTFESFTEKPIADSGRRRIIPGANCTLPDDAAVERFDWMRKKAAAFV
jgi:hypothetical protein